MRLLQSVSQCVAAVCLLGVSVFTVASADEKNDAAISFDARLSEYGYPYPVQQYAFESQRQSLEMAYMHLPGKPGKPTVLLLHGKNFAADYWQNTAELLQKKGYGVLMPDQIGFGKSSKPAHYQFSFEALAANTHGLTQQLGINNLVVMGHSMGGMLATRYALNYASQVDQLVLVNPVGLEDYLQYVEYKDPSFFYQSELNKTIEGVIAYQKKNYYDGQWSDEYEALTTIHKGWLNGPDWPQVAWNNALTYDLIFTGAVVNELDELTVPTHLIIGTRDTTGPGRGWKKPGVTRTLGQYDKLGKQAAEVIPNATLHELDDVGHMPQFEAFERYKVILNDIFKQ
ncbi:alpha/beta fold hydrolase [Gilvimarinus agarilyticus]|uniref:alpha/beta fold hydrolase n=1 Tax=Gilvimarinus agarilyticus TaxID=679259 RepID=UPI000696C5A0|nr:alpha/beta hydrolase [Gilvimarinus agarilyticus]